jgi:3D (Asp-Asp-Asp) domain-containing protein
MLEIIILGFAVLVSGCGGYTGSQQNSVNSDIMKASRSQVMGMTFGDVNRGGGLRKRLTDTTTVLEKQLEKVKEKTEEDSSISFADLKFLDDNIFLSSYSTQTVDVKQTDEGLSQNGASIGDDLTKGLVKNLPAEVTLDAIESKGTVTPSVYFFAAINEDRNTCAVYERKDLVDPDGKLLDRVCPKTLAECDLQGTCLIRRNGKNRLFNVHSKRDGTSRFFEMTRTQCRYGYGVQSSCLDPFYTVAADLSIYKPGDVLFIPGVVGTQLPDGSKHSGYFIVRDRGRGIVGKGRFDFYSGFMSWRDAQNPLVKLGLSDKKNRIPYYKLKGELVNKILSERGFPFLPKLK